MASPEITIRRSGKAIYFVPEERVLVTEVIIQNRAGQRVSIELNKDDEIEIRVISAQGSILGVIPVANNAIRLISAAGE